MRFGGVVAVDRVSVAVAEGELRCLIGPNGAGKSTFFRCLTGQYRPTSGRILWRGRDVTGQDPFRMARLGIGIKTQVPALFDGLPVVEGVRLAARRLHGERASRRLADAALGRLGIAHLADRPACWRMGSDSSRNWRPWWHRGRTWSSWTSRQPAWAPRRRPAPPRSSVS